METFSTVEELLPKLVVIDEGLTRLAEFEVMRGLFQTLDVRWLVLGSHIPATTTGSKAGADLFGLSPNASGEELLSQIRSVVRAGRRPAKARVQQSNWQTFGDSVILIGASTGGVDALLKVLRHFPNDGPPCFVVQHTGKGFGSSLIRLLDSQTGAQVVRAEHGMPIPRGTICVGAGIDRHLEIRNEKQPVALLVPRAAVSGHKPSVDALFASAVPLANRCTAALLTGMGKDGAAGMRALHDAGAATIAQDQSTSVVYGMPRAAMEMGGVQQQLPLDQIGPALLKAAQKCAVNNRNKRIA
ncbi:CheB methylesterase domain-containing protein [Pseudoprimorskyibacter insulae]|nr:CheB methylesterase domain-containing protein [Pseudoprimorskyibacter insulae]